MTTPTPTPLPTPLSNTLPPGPLSGKVAVVTGAARGLGAAIALNLAQRGARLALIGLEPEALAQTAATCTHAYQTPFSSPPTSPSPTSYAPSTPTSPSPNLISTWHADVTDLPHLTNIAQQVQDHFGQVDIVVANAGIALGGPTADADPEAFNRVIEVNLLGSIATARAFLPALTRSQGYLLQIASLAAMAPAPLMAAYCASKSGVEAFAHSLHAEVRHLGVDVGVAYLSWTDTDMVRSADEDPVLKDLRAGLPWPSNRTAPLAPAATRIADGIVRRSSHIYAQPWIRVLQWLPRQALPKAVTRRGSKEIARLAPRLHETSHLRQHPLGPGGEAATAARKPPTPATPEPATVPPPTRAANQVANHPPA